MPPRYVRLISGLGGAAIPTRLRRLRAGSSLPAHNRLPTPPLLTWQGAGKGKRVMGGKPHDAAMPDAEGAAALPPGAAPSGRIPVPRAAVRLPLEVATHLECRWRDEKFYPARIIERRKVDGGAEDEYEYYVHYRKCE